MDKIDIHIVDDNDRVWTRYNKRTEVVVTVRITPNMYSTHEYTWDEARELYEKLFEWFDDSQGLGGYIE